MTKENKILLEKAWKIIRILSPESVPIKNKEDKEINPLIVKHLNEAKENIDIVYDLLPYDDEDDIPIELSLIRSDINGLIGKIKRYDFKCPSE